MKGAFILPAGIGAAVVVGLLWTCLTGALWQWPVILVAVLVMIGVAAATKEKR